VVVPVATIAEMSGTFVNAKGMTQRFRKAITAPGGIRTAWETLVEIGHALGWTIDMKRLNDVRRDMPAPQLAADAGASEQAAPA
jgi:NADH dehydrogenase/NADH:ubiquinone oxidoreductase subunit G